MGVAIRGELIIPLDQVRCWNSMPPWQQDHLALTGTLDFYEAGGSCTRPADTAVECGNDAGPRLYCLPCAIDVIKRGEARAVSVATIARQGIVLSMSVGQQPRAEDQL